MQLQEHTELLIKIPLIITSLSMWKHTEINLKYHILICLGTLPVVHVKNIWGDNSLQNTTWLLSDGFYTLLTQNHSTDFISPNIFHKLWQTVGVIALMLLLPLTNHGEQVSG